jgi:glycosyltransferase involved in cell wall biosynthesis
VRGIPNGIDLEEFDRRAAERSPASRSLGCRPAVVMVANLVPWKGHQEFLALAVALKKREAGVLIFVAGSGTPAYERELKREAERAGLGNTVVFLGRIDNVPRLLSQVDALVHTTDREPFGRVFIEAMAARRPVVAFEGGGASEIIRQGETGILVPPGNIGAFADAVEKLLADEGLRRRMGEAGRRRVEREYTIERHVAAVLALHQEVLARGRSRLEANGAVFGRGAG